MHWTHRTRRRPHPAVSAVQVVDPKAGVNTVETAFKTNSVGQNLNQILNKAKKWGCPARLLEVTEQRDIFHVWDPGGPNMQRSAWQPNDHLVRVISQEKISDLTTDSCGLENNLRMISALDNSVSRTELDSRANMVCLVRNAIIIEDTGKMVDVKSFTPD